MLNCKHYEQDTKEKAICDEMWEDYWNSLTPAQQKAEKEHAKQIGKQCKSKIPKKCQNFCKHLTSGKGHPGETMVFCQKTGKTFDYHFDIKAVE